MNKLAVVRLRGNVNVRKEVEDTLHMLRLNRPNHCTLLSDDSSHRGMLQKAKEIITWGLIKPEVLEKLLIKRGKFEGDKSVTEEKIIERTSFKSIEEFAKKVVEDDFDLSEVEGLQEVFRLHPPKKGLKSVRRSISEGGSLGNRGEGINDLILRML